MYLHLLLDHQTLHFEALKSSSMLSRFFILSTTMESTMPYLKLRGSTEDMRHTFPHPAAATHTSTAATLPLSHSGPGIVLVISVLHPLQHR